MALRVHLLPAVRKPRVYTWWLDAAAGLVHGLFLLAGGLPLLPFTHPRMASEYDGASTTRQLEPPGFMGLN
jgi:hypothetical protein